MRTPLLRRLAVLSLGLLCSAGSVLGEDAPDAPPTTELRVHPIGALVRPHPWFLADRGPFPVGPTQVNSRDQPLFGSVVAEDARPVGTVEQVVEAIRSSVGEPGDWEAEGTSIWVEGGPDLLFVQAPAALQAEVARQLAAWAGEACTTQVLDVAVFEGDVAAARGPGGLPAAVASRALFCQLASIEVSRIC